MAKRYADKLRSPKWQKKRLDIMNRDSFQCVYCHDKETILNVHHDHYKGNPWEAGDDKLKTVCEHCHQYVCHNDDVIDILTVEKFLVNKDELHFLINCKDRDILLSLFNGERNTMIFAKKSNILAKIAKLNKK